MNPVILSTRALTAAAILLAAVTAACGPRTAARTDAPVPPVVIPSPPIHRMIEVCVLQGGKLVHVNMQQNSVTGDTVFPTSGCVPLFVDAGESIRPPEMLYVPVRPGCEFQPYARDLLLRGVRG